MTDAVLKEKLSMGKKCRSIKIRILVGEKSKMKQQMKLGKIFREKS